MFIPGHQPDRDVRQVLAHYAAVIRRGKRRVRQGETVRPRQHFQTKRLRCLATAQLRAVRDVVNDFAHVGLRDRHDRVGGIHHDGRGVEIFERCHARTDGFRPHKRSHGVMDQNDSIGWVFAQCRQGRPSGRIPRSTTDGHGSDLAVAVTLRDFAGGIGVPGGHEHQDFVDVTARLESVQGMREDFFTVEREQLFRKLRSKSRTGASGQDRGDRGAHADNCRCTSRADRYCL